MASGLGDGYDGFGGFGHGYQVLQEAGVEEGEVDGEDQVEVRCGSGEGGVDSAQGAAGGIDIGDGGGEGGEFFGIADDFYISDRRSGPGRERGREGTGRRSPRKLCRSPCGSFCLRRG